MPESVQASSSKEIVPYEAIAQPVTVAGGSFGTPEALNNALRRWSIEFPRDVYINLLNEAVSRVTEVIEQHENSRDRILINMYELGRETLGNDFSKFKRTTEYRHIWFKVTTALKNAKKNQNSTQTARQTVINQWGDDGRRFLEFNSAQGWTKAAGRLARACPEYIQATNYIVNAIFDRLNNMRSGRSLALRPGLTDLQTAITFSKQPNPPQPVSENELKALGVQRNAPNLLEPSEFDDLAEFNQPLPAPTMWKSKHGRLQHLCGE
ncbi:hypothetical protein FQN54_008941 [Arachnomyces sp. PD_36]|nr:hypothetical protein FQN54_008941 [Arachnomyces sp. PD_36]